MRRFVSGGQTRRGVQVRVPMPERRFLQPHDRRVLLHAWLDGKEKRQRERERRGTVHRGSDTKFSHLEFDMHTDICHRVRCARIDARTVSGARTALKAATATTEPAAITSRASVSVSRDTTATR